MIPDGLITHASRHDPKTTMDRFAASVIRNGMTIFARIDHAAAAHEVGLTLEPTELLIFGAAKAGTPLMRGAQTIAIDLPLKILTWRDASSTSWLSYNAPAWLGRRHGLGEALGAVLDAMTLRLEAMAVEATANP